MIYKSEVLSSITGTLELPAGKLQIPT